MGQDEGPLRRESAREKHVPLRFTHPTILHRRADAGPEPHRLHQLRKMRGPVSIKVMTFSDLMKKLLLAGWFVASLAGCPKPSPTPVPPVPPMPNPYVVDAGEPPTVEYTCADMCSHLFDLKCPGAEPTASGATCLEVCQNVQSSGVVAFNLRCRVNARTCAAADACK